MVELNNNGFATLNLVASAAQVSDPGDWFYDAGTDHW